MKITFDSIMDTTIKVGAIAGLLTGAARFVGKVDKVPTLEKKVNRIEHAVNWLVQGEEARTKRHYIPPREVNDEGANR